jgi:hypothetical protein
VRTKIITYLRKRRVWVLAGMVVFAAGWAFGWFGNMAFRHALELLGLGAAMDMTAHAVALKRACPP